MQDQNSSPMFTVACSKYDLRAEGLTVEQVTGVPQRGLVKRVSRMTVMGQGMIDSDNWVVTYLAFRMCEESNSRGGQVI